MHPDFSSTLPRLLSPQDKLGNISVSKKPQLLCVGTGDRKSRTEKQRTRGGETEKEMEE